MGLQASRRPCPRSLPGRRKACRGCSCVDAGRGRAGRARREPGQLSGNVLRLEAGAELLVFDGRSGEWLARIAEAAKKRMKLTVERRTREPETVPDVWLAFAPVKRAQTDWLVEKATELGAARLIPVMTRRTIAERVKLERLQAIAIEAAEQCGRTRSARDRRAAGPGAASQGSGPRPLFRRRTGRRAGRVGVPAGTGDDPDRARGRIHRWRARACPRGAEQRRHLARAAHPARRNRRARRACEPIWRSPGTARAKRRRHMTQRTDTGDSPLIESRADLIAVFEGGEKPREAWRIGTEHEKFVYRVERPSRAVL